MLLDIMVSLTVSFVLSSRCPFFHHVIVAGGLDPELWHSKSYLLPADKGWFAPRIFTSSGPTGNKNNNLLPGVMKSSAVLAFPFYFRLFSSIQYIRLSETFYLHKRIFYFKRYEYVFDIGRYTLVCIGYNKKYHFYVFIFYVHVIWTQ